METVATLEELHALYGTPMETSTAKEVDRVTREYGALIEASPFAVLATSGPEGLDASPRGDLPGFVRIHDERTLLMPDRHGNNRIDSLRNIVRDPRAALLFFIPGLTNTLRVNASAHVTADRDLLESFAVEGKAPRSVIVFGVQAVYFQCARALMRSHLWDPETFRSPRDLPTPGAILAALTESRIGGEDYDRTWPERAKSSMW